MKIILNQDVMNLGEEGDIVVVKNGYARNYLLPQGYAVIYNRTNAAVFAQKAEAIEKRKIEKRAQSASLQEKLNGLQLQIVVSAGDTGKLFGSVTSAMVQDALAKAGYDIEKKKIEVASHEIKMIGTYSVKVRLYENDFATVKIDVESEASLKEKAAEAAAAEAAAKAEAEKAAAEEAPAVEEEAKAEEVTE